MRRTPNLRFGTAECSDPDQTAIRVVPRMPDKFSTNMEFLKKKKII